MKVDRRDFLRFAAASGVAIPSWGLIPSAVAQTAGIYAGKVLINVLADGGIVSGWWTDPKNDPTVVSWRTPVNGVTPEPVVAAGLRMSPRGNNAAFLAAYAPHMMFINGVNMQTNDHGAGRRVSATGSLDMGFPNVSALFASVHGRGTAFPWLSAAGADVSQGAGLAAATPMPNANSLVALANPNAVSLTQDFMKQADVDKTLVAQAARMQAMQARGDLAPRLNIMTKQFLDSSEARATLARIAQFIPATFNATFPQAHAGMVAAQAGITTTIQLSTGGFDVHGNSDAGMQTAMPRLTNMIDFIWQTAAAMGIDNRIMVRIHSDFGRTPMNNGNGTDHWGPGGTMVLMERNAPWAGRAFGATGPRYQPVRINVATGAVDPVAGAAINPRHVHAALRNYLGINTTDPRFNLRVPANEMFDFFNPAASTGYPSM